MKKGNSSPLTPELQAEIKRLEAMRDEDIDFSDIPRVEDFSGFVRGRFYRPVKRQLTLRLDADVVDFFEAAGKGYQTRINAALREWVAAQRRPKAG